MSVHRVRAFVVPSRLAAFAVASFAAWIGGDPTIEAAPDDPTATMARIARDLDLQTKMPGPETPEPEDHWSSVHWHIPGSLAEWIMAIALVVGLAFALFALRDSIPGISRRKREPARPRAVVLPSEAAVARLTEAAEDADDLARRGLFAEAMHMLLLRSLAEMRKRLGVTISDALTSREILRRLALPDAGRAALADLIGRVEPVHFGAKRAEPADYGNCRASFDALIGAMRSASDAAA